MISHRKVALVTSAGSNIGRSIALRLARDGADIALLDSRIDELNSVANEIAALGRRTSLTVAPIGQSESIETAIENAAVTLGRFDIMVNNLSLDRTLKAPAMSLEEVVNFLTLNIKCTHWGIQAAAKKFRHLSVKGTIVNVSSSYGYESSELLSAYSASKHAMQALSQAAAKELAHDGIRVTLQCFGSIIPTAKYT